MITDEVRRLAQSLTRLHLPRTDSSLYPTPGICSVTCGTWPCAAYELATYVLEDVIPDRDNCTERERLHTLLLAEVERVPAYAQPSEGSKWTSMTVADQIRETYRRAARLVQNG